MFPTDDYAARLGLREDDFGPLQLLQGTALWWSHFGKHIGYDCARQMFEAIAILAPDDPRADLGLAGILFEEQRDEECERVLDEATYKENNDPMTLAQAAMMLGALKMRAGEGAAAREHFERTIAYDLDEGVLSAGAREELAKLDAVVAAVAARVGDSRVEGGDERY